MTDQNDAGTLHYACDMDGRASSIPLALWRMNLIPSPGELDKRPKLTFEPIRGAYVACIEIKGSGPIRERDIRYARSSNSGWLFLRELDAMGKPRDVPDHPYEAASRSLSTKLLRAAVWPFALEDPVMFQPKEQCANPDLLSALPNQTLRIFWTYDESVFHSFARQLKKDPSAALKRWGAREYKVMPFGKAEELAGLDLLSDVPPQKDWPEFTERRVAARLLFPGERQGYHLGAHFKDHVTAAIFDATPNSLRALFLSEWLEWYSVQLRADENWRALFTALHVSQIAEQGAKVEEFERQVRENVLRTTRKLGGSGIEPRILAAFEDYRRYAYDCAKVCAGLGGEARDKMRDRFLVAIDVRSTEHGGWLKASAELRTDHGLKHPAETGQHRDALVLDPGDEQEPLIAYFDYYVEGLRYKADGLTQRIRVAMPTVDEAFEWIASKRRALLREEGKARHDRLMRDLGACVADLQHRFELNDRHARQCAILGVAWWREADESYLATRGAWQAFVQTVPWLSGEVNGIGDLLGGFMTTYSALYEHTPESAESMVRLCLRYERWLQHGVLDDLVLPKVAAHWQVRSSGKSVSLALQVGKRRLYAGEYLVLETHEAARGSYTGPTGHLKHVRVQKLQEREISARLKRRVPEVLVMDPEVIERLEGGAGVIGTLGALLDIGLSVRDIANSSADGLQLVESDVMPVATAAWSSLQFIDSFAQVVKFARKAQGWAPLAETTLTWAGRAGALGVGIEGCAALYQGLQALYSDESNLVAALDRGAEGQAMLEFTKGVAQTAMGAGGAGACLAGLAGLSVVAGPFGMVFGLGSVAVVVIDVAIYARSDRNRVEPLIDRVLQAKRSEFHLDARDHQTQRESQQVRLRQRLGVLNEKLKHALPVSKPD